MLTLHVPFLLSFPLVYEVEGCWCFGQESSFGYDPPVCETTATLATVIINRVMVTHVSELRMKFCPTPSRTIVMVTRYKLHVLHTKGAMLQSWWYEHSRVSFMLQSRKCCRTLTARLSQWPWTGSWVRHVKTLVMLQNPSSTPVMVTMNMVMS